MVPKGWTKRELGSILEFKNGINTDASNYGFGTKFVNVMDVFATDALTHNQIRGSVNITDDQVEMYALRRGDILFNRTSETREEIAFASVYLDDEPAVFGGFVIRGRPTDEVLDPSFSRYCFRTNEIRRELTRRCQGVIRANIGQSDMSEVCVLLPPMEEQKDIATILTTWDRAIGVVDNLIRKSEAEKRALMQLLLTGKKRLAGCESAWHRRLLGNLFCERTETNRQDLPLLSITSNAGVILQSEVGRKDSSNDDKSKYKRICPGDIGYNTMRMWQGVSALSAREGVVSPAYTIVTSKGDIDPLFAAYLFKHPRTIHDFRQHSQGLTSDTWNLKFPLFARIEILLPDLEQQKRIAHVLQRADGLIKSLVSQREMFESEKQALMQPLLTGTLRVSRDKPKEVARA